MRVHSWSAGVTMCARFITCVLSWQSQSTREQALLSADADNERICLRLAISCGSHRVLWADVLCLRHRKTPLHLVLWEPQGGAKQALLAACEDKKQEI